MFLQLLEDIVRSTKILNEREISGSKARKKDTRRPERGKRKLEGEEEDQDMEEEEGESEPRVSSGLDGGMSCKKVDVGIELRLKNRTTGSVRRLLLMVTLPKLIK